MVKWAENWLMTLNLTKCKHMEIGNNEKTSQYNIRNESSNITIQKVSTEKDLGVIIDEKLNFSEQANIAAQKGNRIMGVIFKSFTYMDQHIFRTLYKSLVRPHLEYATTIWSPFLQKDIIKIENVQRRATKRIKNIKDLSYEDRLRTLGLPTLEYRRKRCDLIQLYKIINKHDKIVSDTMFSSRPYQSTRGNTHKLFKRQVRLNTTKNAFSNRVVNHWNALPNEVVNAKSINSFKTQLNKYWKTNNKFVLSDHP
ncbi:uncharacterized protein [Argopecten irradians]|uniref:uncharacterized protein n=1 Tax=Argopecten irradians TaxID=31199 RepID=UPI003713F2F8